MFYEFSLVVPANTPVTSPVSLAAKLVPGTIDAVEIQFWAGQRGNVHVRILDRQHQLWPTNLGDWITSDAYTVTFIEQYVLSEIPHTLHIHAYNEDTDYEHEIIVRFSVSIGRWTLEDLARLLTGPVEVVD